jgi:hypothetical protein
MIYCTHNEKDYYIADVIGSGNSRRKTEVPNRIMGLQGYDLLSSTTEDMV